MSADATGRTAYTYDAWGRTVTKQHMADPANTYTATYMYRFGDKLKRYETNIPGEETGIYNYDGLGKRRLKLVDDDYTWFRWAGWSILSEYGEGTDPNTLWDIAATPDKVYTPGLAERTSSSDYAYYLQDHLGSTRQVLDGTKALQAHLDYTPYGEPDAWAGALPSVTYTGHYWDPETGMYFAPFRYLMPGEGRWLTRDPLGFVDGLNVYAYVACQPTLTNDPLGLRRPTEKDCQGYFNECLKISKELLVRAVGDSTNSAAIDVGCLVAAAVTGKINLRAGAVAGLTCLGLAAIQLSTIMDILSDYNRATDNCGKLYARCLDRTEK